jgi:microcystin-dependent protein
MGPLMLKRAALILGAIIYASIAHAAGTVPGFSLTPQFDLTGKVMPGCLLYVYQAGTVATPQNAYQDTGLTNLQPNPMTCDASGRIPQWFVADGLIKLRLTTSTGTQVFVGDNLLVIGPSSGGGGGGGTVDPTTIFSTGDTKAMYGTGPVSGWVRMNGRTIGSATSGATERANADTNALFLYLWAADANLAVSGGRGASAAADWSANKTIALPDLRGRVLSGLDDMGNTDSARQAAGALGSCRFTLGCAGGESTHTLAASEIPSITSGGTASVTSTSGSVITGNLTANLISGGTGASFQGIQVGSSGSGALSSTGSASVTSTNTSGGSHNNMQPTMLATYYIKL